MLLLFDCTPTWDYTILNLGLNSQTLKGVIEHTGNARFAYDAYRRFIQLFGKVALGVPDELFDEEFEAVKQRSHVTEDLGLSADDLKEKAVEAEKAYEKALADARAQAEAHALGALQRAPRR